jgi:hypothetical protein
VLNHIKFEKMDLVRLDHLCIALPPVALSRPTAKKIKPSTQQVTIHKSDNTHNTQFTHHRIGTRETQHERKDVDTLEMAAAAKGRVQLLLLLVVPPPPGGVLPCTSSANDFGCCSTKFRGNF